MTYFSRLTDIVTCNLTDLLRESDNPAVTLNEILYEMEEGLAGARRSVNTAHANAGRLQNELADARTQMTSWQEVARNALQTGDEQAARLALSRKQELEDVAAGLEQEYAAAVATRDHLETTQRALQARLNDAKRKHRELSGDTALPIDAEPDSPSFAVEHDRVRSIDEQLAALKQELGLAEG